MLTLCITMTSIREALEIVDYCPRSQQLLRQILIESYQ